MKPKLRRRLSRRIWTRRPGSPSRFAFAPNAPVGLTLEPVTDQGRTAFSGFHRSLARFAPQAGKVSGVALVDDQGRYVLCTRKRAADLLPRLARYVADHLQEFPALAGFLDAGTAQVDVDLDDDEAVRGLRAEGLAVHRDPALWDGLLVADEALVASALEHAGPGERLWFWLDPTAAPGEVPLLVQPVEQDPDRHRIDALIAQFYPRGRDPGIVGFAKRCGDGRLQFVSPEARPHHPGLLAAWVREAAGEHPGLCCLVGAEFVVARGGRVQAIHGDPGAWAGLERPPAGGTPEAVAAALAGLPPGADAWFWLSPSGIFELSPVADDPEGDGLRDAVWGHVRGVPGAGLDATRGVLRRLGSGALVFTAARGSEHWASSLGGWLATAGAPGLDELRSARLLRLDGGKPRGVDRLEDARA